MTEMASTIFAKLADGQPGVGQLLQGREYQLVEQEVWLKGAGLALGYWDNTTKTIKKLTNEQGWLATKDRATIQNNELVLLGRLDNMFISGGENIQAEEIEGLLNQHPNVMQSMVFPVPDQEFGQRPVALVQFKQSFSSQQVEQLEQWLVGKIEKFKKPIAYLPLHIEIGQQKGSIKLSRSNLQKWLEQQWNRRT